MTEKLRAFFWLDPDTGFIQSVPDYKGLFVLGTLEQAVFSCIKSISRPLRIHFKVLVYSPEEKKPFDPGTSLMQFAKKVTEKNIKSFVSFKNRFILQKFGVELYACKYVFPWHRPHIKKPHV